MNRPELKIIVGEFTIYRLTPAEEIPPIVLQSDFYWIGKTDEELSLICDSKLSVNCVIKEAGWSILKINCKLDFGLVGIFADIATILAHGEISIIALSTFDTDYLMMKNEKLEAGVKALKDAGYIFE